MIPYYAKQIESAELGERIVGVQCEKCSCEYCYELTRIGEGKGTAHYGVGAADATRAAIEQSLRDVRQRLALEAELVPCPKCNWINNELVHGYRLGQFRNAGMIALGVGFLGTIGSLICAWFISIGPAADRVALPYFLFGGPTLFISLAVGVILFRSWIRSRIQPNRNFPLAPILPPGTPPALLMKNESTGEFSLAAVDGPQEIFVSDWHDFQIGRHQFPDQCCGCLQVAAREHSFKQPVSAAIDLDIPRCETCARNSKRKLWRTCWSTVLVGLLIAVGISMVLKLEAAEFWILVAVSLSVSFAIGVFIGSATTSPVKVVRSDLSRGVVRLRFRNAEYGKLISQRLTKA